MILLSKSLAIFASTSVFKSVFIEVAHLVKKLILRRKGRTTNAIKKRDAVTGKGEVIELLNLEVD